MEKLLSDVIYAQRYPRLRKKNDESKKNKQKNKSCCPNGAYILEEETHSKK